ncbi:hypothetical protein F2Q68_00044405 [Brassica cretica]|uniref:Uncharacterized protein n=2 Tax=Brassica cretica TaxID=69181 RepID=A0ABQ7ATA0_BRACR|nr:hypothetical protein F2Q68_00044405 [Brassica cretica]KAF3517322.1 hypothetical protein DY000_02060501 [Brassica cretica]
MINLAIERVRRGSSNSPNGELNWSIQLTIGRVGRAASNSPSASWTWLIQLARWRQPIGPSSHMASWLASYRSNSPDGQLASHLWVQLA